MGIPPSYISTTLGYSPADCSRLRLRGEILEHGDGTICPESLSRVMMGAVL